ncbi:DDB1- and CUL4-associated factor 1-like isoform X2 [Clytia hemisphaerica]|uniref:DDB1- and CUL4-associated factor 1-like isoform X2 n=1 Tax=Clytia hemisphaerica TaxID=252671 RepID=UPI0034D3FB1B
MALLEKSSKLKELLDKLKEINRLQHSPVEVFDQISTMLEEEANVYDASDPDPFHEQQSHRNIREEADSSWKHLLEIVADADELRYKDQFVPKCLEWAKDGKEPLRSYACALMVKGMRTPSGPSHFMDKICELTKILIQRLQYLSKEPDSKQPCVEDFGKLPDIISTPQVNKKSRKSDAGRSKCDQTKTPTSSRKRKLVPPKPTKPFQYERLSMSLKPLTIGKQQELILRFLYPISEYQELLPIVLETNVLNLIFHYIDHTKQPNGHLACAALMYLSSLLCHKKFIVEFINRHGIQKILEIPQPSSVATMSSLCLYYLVYNNGNEDCIERICLLPHSTLQRLVAFLLKLSESSHVSGRCHSSLFFSLTFSFKAILQLFDSMDGLRKIVNLISTLKIMRIGESDLSSDDDVYLDHEMAKNACQTLKKYFETHITMIGETYKTSKNVVNQLPKYKPLQITPESLEKSFNKIIKNTSDGVATTKEGYFLKKIISLEIPQLLLQLITTTAERKNYEHKNELLVTALDILLALSVFKEIAFSFCQKISINAAESSSGMGILLTAIEGSIEKDIEVRKAALKVLCNCVTSSKSLIQDNTSAITNPQRKNLTESNGTDTTNHYSNHSNNNKVKLIEKIWSSFRSNNGIMILLRTLEIASPLTEADSIRALVCKALYGIAENKLISQILGRLPMFHNEEIHQLMKEPILSDRITEHNMFTQYASLLLERVTGIPSKTTYNSAQASIISQTRITYSQKELLQVVYNHLKKSGLSKAAEVLKDEADLPSTTEDKRTTFGTPSITIPKDLCSPSITNEKTPFNNKTFSRTLSTSNTPISSPQTERRVLFTPNRRKSIASPSVFTPQSSQSPVVPKQQQYQRPVSPPPPTLDNIITSYLREQHARCANPVATCPPFSLFRPHNCPKPKYRQRASNNITKRLFDRQGNPPQGGQMGCKYTRRFLYSKFRSGVTYRGPGDEEEMYTAGTWMSDSGSMAFGTVAGYVKVVNYLGQDELAHTAHESAIISIESSKDCKLIATSAEHGPPTGCVWRVVESPVENGLFSLENAFELPEDAYLKFNNSQDRVIGTNTLTANVYDLGTGQRIGTYHDENNTNNYTKNNACFSPCDNLLLNDGVLWDIRGKQLIHKFDKFNNRVSGIFHPAGREIIIDSEVWDLRTFRLLDTYPELEDCHIRFSGLGDVFYTGKLRAKYFDSYLKNGILGPYESSFRVFDAYDYSALGTVDTKRIIIDVLPDPSDQCLAVLEDDPVMRFEFDTTCRIYNIGRTKRFGEEEEESESDENEENGHESSADNDEGDDEDAETMMEIFSNLLGEGDDLQGDEDDDEATIDGDEDDFSGSDGDNDWVDMSDDDDDDDVY